MPQLVAISCLISFQLLRHSCIGQHVRARFKLSSFSAMGFTSWLSDAWDKTTKFGKSLVGDVKEGISKMIDGAKVAAKYVANKTGEIATTVYTDAKDVVKWGGKQYENFQSRLFSPFTMLAVGGGAIVALMVLSKA